MRPKGTQAQILYPPLMSKGHAGSARQRQKYEQYKNNHTREKNKIRKLKKYLQIHGNNVKMLGRIEELEDIVNSKPITGSSVTVARATWARKA